VENINGQVDELVKTGTLCRILPLLEVAFSNSMIEAWWRSLRRHMTKSQHRDMEKGNITFSENAMKVIG